MKEQIKIVLTPSHFKALINSGISLDIYYLLNCCKQGIDINSLCLNETKLEALYQSLFRKGYIDSNDKITKHGEAVLAFIPKEKEVKIPVVKKDVTSFDLWWKAYPGTDSFKVGNKIFNGSRGLRVKKDDCKIKLQKVLDEGEFTIDELIKALQFEINQKVKKSLETNQNKMSFMQNSLTYLNQRTFEPFAELIKEGHIIEEIKETGKPVEIKDLF